jgi:hypothetical protein
MLTDPSAAPLLAAGATIQNRFAHPGWLLIGDHDAPINQPGVDAGTGDTEDALTQWRESPEAGGAVEARRARWIAGFCRSRPSANDRPDTEIGAAAAPTRAARPPILATVSGPTPRRRPLHRGRRSRASA